MPIEFNLLSKNFGSEGGRDAIKSEFDNVALEYQKAALADAIRYPYRVTTEQASQIASCFPARYTMPVASYKDCSHPVLAVLNDYANEDASAQVKRLGRDGIITMTIGDSADKKIGANHNCLYVRDVREAHRITSNYKSPRDLVNHAAFGENTIHCIDGCHNCDFQARHAFAVHSVYDISMDEIYATFARHGLESMTVYMYFTTTILTTFRDPYAFFGVEYHAGGSKVTFTMADESFCYEHDVELWKAWHTTTLIKGREFSVTLEVVRQFGPLRVVKLQRVANKLALGELVRYIPLKTYFPNMMLVPDLFWLMKKRFAKCQADVRHYLVPENVVTALMAYANRASEQGYLYHELAAYASGLRRRIVIGSTTFQDPWYCGPEEYNRVLFALFILGAIQRTDRTQGIKATFQYLKEHANAGFFGNMVHEANLKFNQLLDWVFGNDFTPEIEVMGKRLWEFKAISLKDIKCSKTHYTSFFNRPPLGPVHRHDYEVDVDQISHEEGEAHVQMDSLSNVHPLINKGATTQVTLEEYDIDNVDQGCDDTLLPSMVKPEEPKIGEWDKESAHSTVADEETLSVYFGDLNAYDYDNQSVDSLDSLRYGAMSHVGINTAVCDIMPQKRVHPPGYKKSEPIDIVRKDDVKKRKFPSSFQNGHCALRTFYQVANLKDSYSIEDFMDLSATLLMASDFGFSQDVVDGYIHEGKWQDNDCSGAVLNCLTVGTGRCLTIYVYKGGKGKETCDTIVIGDETAEEKLYVQHRFGHYTPSSKKVVAPNGGAVAKFDGILDNYSWLNVNVLDISAAPGYLSNKLRSRGAKVTSGHYIGGSKYTQQKGANIIPYDHYLQLFEQVKKMKFSVIINDAARDVNSEDLINEINDKFVGLLKVGGMLITKTFGNPHHTWALAYDFKHCNMVYESEECSERFFSLTGYQQGDHKQGKIQHFHSLYDRDGWNRKETQHTLPYCNNAAFATHYFLDPTVKKFRPKDIYFIEGFFQVTCITGFASASKTTNALKAYPDAVMIAPSKDLTKEHQKMGVASFTPHVFFSHKHSRSKTIIVDEAFQFPVEYFSLLKMCYPNHKIILLGDVEQTPMVNYCGMKTKSLLDFGIGNSAIDVYKIPQDIADSLNSKHGYYIRSHSKVNDGWARLKGDIDQFIGSTIHVICFNSDSAKDLRARGINASTITTYTGSRDHTVVFYVDSASIMSQLINRPEYIYTAVSRATNKLVLAGDTQSIVRYYNIHGSKLMTFEEISGNYNAHHIRMPDDNQIKVVVPSEIALDPPCLGATIQIIEHNMQPLNDPEGTVFGNYTADIAPVAEGKLTTPMDAVMATDIEAKGWRFPLNTKLTKHQISNNTLQAVQTLTKRYAKSYKQRLTTRKKAFGLTTLMKGLCKAIYGDEHNIRKLKFDMRMDPDVIREKYGDYMESLQEKLKSNPGAAKDLEIVYEFEFEKLGFFNKKQTKFDPKPGFDTSDKVGQGVAATSKRFNILLAGYARAMLDRVKELLIAHGRKIVLATHDSEAGLNDTYMEFIDEFKDSGKANFSCNDFSEWDSSFRQPFAALTKTLLDWMGCPAALAEEWMCFRESWTMIYQHAFGSTVLNGKEKQFSGNPFTICENTIGNMALCFVIFDYKGFKWAFFKGDDSAVRCKSCKLTGVGREFLEFTGHGLKLHNSPIGEFAGWFMTENGFFPDVYRYTAKFLDKVYLDQKHFNEALNSLQERCSAVKNNMQLNTGAAMCALYYQGVFGPDSRTSVDDVITLFNFLKGSRTVTFEDLVPVTLPLMVY